MEFSSLLHLITTAVAAKLTYTLNERLDQMASREQGSGSSSFTQQMMGRRVGESRTVLESARTSHSSTVQTHSDASDSLYEGQANNLPQADLQKLEDAVTAAEQAVTDAATKLSHAADAHQKSILAALPALQQAKIQKSADLVASTQAAQQKAQQQSESANQAYIAEKKNPTGQDLSNLRDAMKHYRRELKVATSATSRASEAHEELTSAITEQIAKTTAENSKVKSSWLQRLLPGPTESNRERLTASLAAHQKANREHEQANTDYRAAQKAYAGEVANPSGKSLTALQATMDALKVKRDEAAKRARNAADAHLDMQAEVNRQTKWQTERQSIGDWANPRKQLRKLSQAVRIGRKKFSRWRGATAKRRGAQAALIQARQYRNGLQQSAYQSVTGRKFDQAEYAKYMANPANAAKVTAKGGSALAGAEGGVKSATVAVATAKAGEVAAGLEAIATAVGPVGIAIGSVVALAAAAVIAAKMFVNRQLQSAEATINSQIRSHADYNGRIAGQIAQYDANQIRLNMKTGQQTEASASGVVQSTMRLQEQTQPKAARWEAIGNRMTTVVNDIATHTMSLLNAVDIITPAVEGTLAVAENIGSWREFLFEKLGLIEKQSKKENDPANNIAIQMFRSVVGANAQARGAKKHPDIPPVR